MFRTEVARLVTAVTELRRQKMTPLVIETGGMPRAGKTVTLIKIARALRRTPLSVLDPPEAPEIIPRYLRSRRDGTPDSVGYNLHLALHQVSNLLKAADDDRLDLVLFDRGPFDRACWVEINAQLGKILPSEAAVNVAWLTQPAIASRINRAVFLSCDPSISLAREQAVAQTREASPTINAKTLRMSYDIGTAFFQGLGPLGAILDTSTITEDEAALALLILIRETAESLVLKAAVAAN